MYDDSIYEEVRRYLLVAMSKYHELTPHLWEDGLQEGMVQAWRDVEAGVEPKLKLLRRSAMASRRYFQRGGETSFGKPAISRTGITSLGSSIEKVQAFLDEFVPVHDRQPLAREVAEALGISRSGASTALKRIREGRYDHMKYVQMNNGSNRKDYTYYSTVNIEDFTEDKPHKEGQSEDKLNILGRYAESSPEDSVISNQYLMDIFKQLEPHHAEVLYLRFFQSYTTAEIAEHFGRTGNSSGKGVKLLNTALSQFKMLMTPYEGSCTKGHERTPETSYVSKMATGAFRRVCKVCTEGATKEPKSLICPNGHTKDTRRSDGYMICSTCKREQQKEYRERKNDSSS